MKPAETLRALLAGAIDYAGLFPPARLAMPDAVRRYDEYLAGADVWALGRFVIPAARLDELAAARQAVGEGKRPWRLSVIIGGDPMLDCAAVRRHNETHGDTSCIDSVEMRVSPQPDTVHRDIAAVMDALGDSMRIFAEVPLGAGMEQLLDAVHSEHASAKVRTGGVTTDTFPSVSDLASFLGSCAQKDVSFKATAGLHHPCRGSYPLTYDADSPKGTMFGFLNVLVAAAFAHVGIGEDGVVSALEVQRPDEFWFGTDEIRWRDVRVSRTQVQETRTELAMSFGSCSFEEPMQDLRALSLL